MVPQSSLLLSRPAPGPFRAHAFRRGPAQQVTRKPHTSRIQAARDATADLLGTVASLALKARLQSYQSVQVHVDCTAWELAQGRVSTVAIHGKQWRSPLGLTAQTLDVKVGTAVIDYGTLIFRQRIALQNIPTGTAAIVFTQEDFANFLQHPLLKRAAQTALMGQPFVFDPQAVTLDAFFGPCGALTVEGTSGRDGQRYRISLMPADCIPQLQAAASGTVLQRRLDAQQGKPQGQGQGQGKGQRREVQQQRRRHVQQELELGAGQQRPLTVVSSRVLQDGQTVQDEGSEAVGVAMGRFFTGLCIDLQGAELTYRSMTVTGASRAEDSDLLRLSLKLRLRDFPPLNVQF